MVPLFYAYHKMIKQLENSLQQCNENLGVNFRLYVWDSKGQVKDTITEKKFHKKMNHYTKNDIFLIAHDIGEHGKIEEIKQLVPKLYQKNPNSQVLSLDWSVAVSNMNTSAYSCTLLPSCTILYRGNKDPK